MVLASDKDPLKYRDTITKEALKPITQANTELEKEMQAWEVESTEHAD
jgi:hypothetical protein